MSARERQDNQPGYVLHTYAFRETSLVVETFTRSTAASPWWRAGRSARVPRCAAASWRSSLGLSWSGRGELRLLLRGMAGGQPRLQGRALLCGFYLNELLLKLLPREERRKNCSSTIRRRSRTWRWNRSPARCCAASKRRCCANWATPCRWTWIKSLQRLSTRIARRRAANCWRALRHRATSLLLSGQTLLDIVRDDYSDPLTLQQAKALMRLLISHRLEQKPLNSRRIFEELRQL